MSLKGESSVWAVLCSLSVCFAACSQGSGGGSSSTPEGPLEIALPQPSRARVVAANDLGMHCMDREYSVFSILPPFNVVHAQVMWPDSFRPVLQDATQVEVRYEAVADRLGSINSTSATKTDFWQHAQALFGVQLAPGEGLLGMYMPGDAPQPGPQPMGYDPVRRMFDAPGIPITPIYDAGATNAFPLLRISAYDRATGRRLASTDIVVPVAQETDCQNCHATGQLAASAAGIPWSTDPDLEVQTKRNVLILHDHDEGTQLLASQPVLCASCHYSPALDLSGSGPQGAQIGNVTMSYAMHNHHGKLLDGGGQPVFPPNGTAQQTCYQCHPGAQTQCARGAMDTGGMECLQCHGDMLSVGGEYDLAAGGSIDGTNDFQARRPWTDLPRCQSCHTGDALNHLSGPGYVLAADGIRLTQAYVSGDLAASAISRPASRFAENPSKLYRFSQGHGGIGCEMCHGSTHAEWPVAPASANDNVTARELQGHSGALMECRACHTQDTLPLGMGGPHGMHNVNDMRFIDDEHGDMYEQDPLACKACHGANKLGTVLSRTSRIRQWSVEGQNIVMPKGTAVGCNVCHSMP